MLGGPRSGKTSTLLKRAQEAWAEQHIVAVHVATSSNARAATNNLIAEQHPQLSGVVRVTTPLGIAREILRRSATQLELTPPTFLSPADELRSLREFAHTLLQTVATDSSSGREPLSLPAPMLSAAIALGRSWLGREAILSYASEIAEQHQSTSSAWGAAALLWDAWFAHQHETRRFDSAGTLVAATLALRGVGSVPHRDADHAKLCEGFSCLLVDDYHRNDVAQHRLLVALTRPVSESNGAPLGPYPGLHVAGDPNGPLWRDQGRSWLLDLAGLTVGPNVAGPDEYGVDQPVQSDEGRRTVAGNLRDAGAPGRSKPTDTTTNDWIEGKNNADNARIDADRYAIICTHRSLEAETVMAEVARAISEGIELHRVAIVMPPRIDPIFRRALRRTAQRHNIQIQEASQRVDSDPHVRALSNVMLAVRTNGEIPSDNKDLLGIPDPLVAELRRNVLRSLPSRLAFDLWDRALAPVLLPSIDSVESRDAIEAVRSFISAIVREEQRHRSWETILEVAGSTKTETTSSKDGVALCVAGDMQGREFEVVIVSGVVEGQWPPAISAFNALDLSLLDGADATEPLARQQQFLTEHNARFHDVCARGRNRIVAVAAPEPGQLPSRWIEGWRRVHVSLAAPTSSTSSASPSGGSSANSSHRYLAETTGLAPMFPGGSLRLSASQLDTFENCPLNYAYQYVAGVRNSGSVQASVGTIVHAALEAFLQPLITHPELRSTRTQEELLSALDRAWDSDVFAYRPQEADYRKRAEDWLIQWWEKEWPRVGEVIATEHRFLIDVGPHQLAGSIDRVSRDEYGTLEIVDYKTGSPAGLGEPEDNLQLAAYFLAAASDPQLISHGVPERLRLHFLQTSMDVEQPITTDHARTTGSRIIERADEILREKFTPAIDADCKYCSFHRVCPTVPEGREVGS